MTLAILRANNPCALRPHPGEGWRGANGTLRLPGGAYQSFSSMAWGLRAALRNLHTYRTRHRLTTPRQIVTRWAPSSDNNPTAAYVRNVARWCGIGPDEPLPFDYLNTRALLLAIARQETGGAYRPHPADLAEAFRLIATEERDAGRDPSPYLPPLSHPAERSRAEAERLPRRGWFGIGAALAGGIAWLQDAAYTVGVYPREALAWLGERFAGVPPAVLIGLALVAAGAALFLHHRTGPNADRYLDQDRIDHEAGRPRNHTVFDAAAEWRHRDLPAARGWRV